VLKLWDRIKQFYRNKSNLPTSFNLKSVSFV